MYVPEFRTPVQAPARDVTEASAMLCYLERVKGVHFVGCVHFQPFRFFWNGIKKKKCRIPNKIRRRRLKWVSYLLVGGKLKLNFQSFRLFRMAEKKKEKSLDRERNQAPAPEFGFGFCYIISQNL